MTLSWSGRRKALYTAVAGVLGLLLVGFIYQALFTAPPMCTDGKQNGTEHGVDCGGTCALLCQSEAKNPVVLWARAFEQAPQTYTAAAYVQNNNPGAGARQVGYTFQLFDDENRLIVDRSGIADIPPVPVVPIIETGITAGNRPVTRALFSFSENPQWIRAGQLPVLSVTGQKLSPDGRRLEATIRNASIGDAKVQVAAVVFDDSGVARAASKSTITVPARGQTPVVFTWLISPPGTARAEITILPLP